MFWGLIMEPKRRYTQVVKKAFHISMASLDITSGNDEPTQVLLTYDGRNYLLCTLQKEKDIQVSLDLNFDEGSEVSFATNGSCHVHLTGYLINEDDDDDDEEDEDDKTKIEKKNENTFKKSIEKKKRKGSEDSSPNVSPKKSKTAQMLEAVNSESDDSDDLNFSDILKEEESDVDEEESSDENIVEESSDENTVEESEDDENGEDGAEEESSLSDDAFEPEKPKVNGVTPKKKEKKQNQEKTPKENQQKNSKKELTKTPKEEKSAQKEKKTEKTPKKEPLTPQNKKKTLEGGVQVQDIVIGNGQFAKPGKLVQVYYEGRLKNNNKVFDSVKEGSGFKFRLGSREVITGWDIGIQGMKVGGKRQIICPPNMAYGQKGSPPVIPSNSTLIFTVELKNVL